MRRIKEFGSLPLVILLLIVFFIIVFYQVDDRSQKKETRKHVSMIVYGDDSERWENMREGAYLVCEEENADLSLITMMSEDDPGEQEEIIEREIDDGADALIIAACNSDEISSYIKNRKPRIPVIFVETTDNENSRTDYVAPDDYNMGVKLGEEIVESESDIVTVAIISGDANRDSVALREKGLRDAIEGKVGKVIDWKDDDVGQKINSRVFIQRAIVSEATDVIVTLDNVTTDALLDALANLNESRKVYSISTSNQAVYYLYNKQIIALEYPDEFSMGYLAAMKVLDKKDAGKKYSDKQIEYRIVRKENMYDKDNQTLLFPFVN